MAAIFIGLISSLFFSATFLVTKLMGVDGTSWAWTAALRFILALPFLFIVVLIKSNFKSLFLSIKKHFWAWLLWGNLAGVGFYFFLSFASLFAPAWLVAASWQLTIVAGLLLSPLFYTVINTSNGKKKVRGKIPINRLIISLFILLGVALMQINAANSISIKSLLLGFIPVAISTVLYPLGNRKLMDVCAGEVDSFQRSFGVSLVSMPLCIILSFYGYAQSGIPTSNQFIQAIILALCSGVIATITFFYATDKAKHNLSLLAAVESTQSAIIIFTIIGSMILLHTSYPKGLSLVGVIIITIGIFINALVKDKKVL